MPSHGLAARRIDGVAQVVAVEAPAEQAAHEVGREAAQEQVEHRRIALAQKIGRPVGARHRRRHRADFGMRVEPADRVGERVGCELDVGVQHELVVGAGAVQHQVVRDAVADVRVAVQEVELDAGVRRSGACRAGSLRRRPRVLAVVDQRERDAPNDALLARSADRERELAQAALEQHGVGPVGDDADGQRRGKQGVKGVITGLAATGILRARWNPRRIAPPRQSQRATRPFTDVGGKRLSWLP